MRPIDADALTRELKSIKTTFGSGNGLVEGGLEIAISTTNAMPTIGEWIPCSERLPEELSVVNVTYVNHDPEPYYDFVKDIAFTETAVYYRGDWYWNWSGCVDVLAEYGRDDANKVDKAVEVIAWMPLPAPYGGESNG